MNALVIYDSRYGNTEKIAHAIANGIASKQPVQLKPVKEVSAADVVHTKFLIVGSPTQGGRATRPIQDFIGNLPEGALRDIWVTAFDTRLAIQEQGLGLRILMKAIGCAAEKIATTLRAKGGDQAVASQGFIVTGKEGPLKAGEVKRAIAWGQAISFSPIR